MRTFILLLLLSGDVQFRGHGAWARPRYETLPVVLQYHTNIIFGPCVSDLRFLLFTHE